MFNLINEYPISAGFYAFILAPFVFFALDYLGVKLYKSLKLRWKRGIAGYKKVTRANKILKIQQEMSMQPHSAQFWSMRHEYLLKNIK